MDNGSGGTERRGLLSSFGLICLVAFFRPLSSHRVQTCPVLHLEGGGWLFLGFLVFWFVCLSSSGSYVFSCFVLFVLILSPHRFQTCPVLHLEGGGWFCFWVFGFFVLFCSFVLTYPLTDFRLARCAPGGWGGGGFVFWVCMYFLLCLVCVSLFHCFSFFLCLVCLVLGSYVHRLASPFLIRLSFGGRRSMGCLSSVSAPFFCSLFVFPVRVVLV